MTIFTKISKTVHGEFLRIINFQNNRVTMTVSHIPASCWKSLSLKSLTVDFIKKFQFKNYYVHTYTVCRKANIATYYCLLSALGNFMSVYMSL